MHLRSFAGATEWLNSEPLGPAELRGHVVLVNLWTWTCINWLRDRFHAPGAHLVLSRGARQPIPFRGLPDGEPSGPSHGVDVNEDGNGVLRDGRLYQLVREHDAVRRRTLEIMFVAPGVEAYAFTCRLGGGRDSRSERRRRRRGHFVAVRWNVRPRQAGLSWPRRRGHRRACARRALRSPVAFRPREPVPVGPLASVAG